MMPLYWRSAGHCRALEALTIQGGRWKVCSYPAKFGLFCHPEKGWCLFDTGYAPRFFEATSTFPYKFYEWATPVEISPNETAAEQAKALGVDPDEINFVIVSHLHGDHVAGLKDFTKATFVTSRSGYEALAHTRGLAAVRRGFLPQLVPEDFESRVHWVDGETDLFQDGFVRLIPLPGHAEGQMGALLQTELGRVFLCADGVWDSRSYRENRDLPWLTHLFLSANTREFRESLAYLCAFHQENPDVLILPSHCSEVSL